MPVYDYDLAPNPTISDETWAYDQAGIGLQVTHLRGTDVLSVTTSDGAGRVLSHTERRSRGYGKASIEVTATTAYQPGSDRIARISANGVVRKPTYDGLGRISG